MVFGHNAADNILPRLRMKFSQKFLIQDVFLSHPQNIQWRYTYDHAQNYIETFRSIMNLLGVDIPSLEEVVQLHFLMTKKHTMEMMECDEELVDSEVLEAVQQRTDNVKIARMTKVEALRRKEMEEEEQAQQRKEEHARQRKKEQEEQALQRKKEQEEQAAKARGKYKTFDNRMEDLKLYKETHGHVNVSIPEDKSLTQFCTQARHARKNPGNSTRKLTNERIAAFDAIGFNWTTQEYVTRSFDERIEDLDKYRWTQGHLNVKAHEDNSLYQFCAQARHSLKQVEKDGTRKLTEERIARLDDLGFKW
jgi:hypothetical protein